jgi:hypothetical protein
VSRMDRSDELRSLALDVAELGFEHRVQELADASHGDVRALADAASSLGSDGWPSKDRIAAIYLSAAYALLTTRGEQLARPA